MSASSCYGLILLIILTSCAHITEPTERREIDYASVEASLCNIDQKVKSHYLSSDIPDGFNESQYEAVVNEICSSNPVCISQIQEIFASYGVRARKVDSTFTVMLCDKDLSRKVMEDFGCNSMLVEVKSWKEGDGVPCKFEDNWQLVLQQYCK
jgi:hypothetical protein